MLTPERRARAERFLAQNFRPLLYNPQIRPHWIGDTDHFWYRHETTSGATIMIVDAATGVASPAADPAALEASVLAPPARPGETLSPDGTLAAFVRAHDLWLRDTATGAERRLTHDSAAHHAWAKSPDMNLTTVTLQRRGITLPANVLWSPDSRKIFTSRLDERDVLDLPLLQHVPDDGSVRPKLHSMKFALSGDVHLPVETHHIIDVTSGAISPGAGPCVTGMVTAIEKEEAWWAADSSRVFYLDRDRLWQRQSLHEMTVEGAHRVIHTETAATFIDNQLSVLGLPCIRILDGSGEFIWYSQASGWGHLYLHDLATGARKSTITQGAWNVRDLLHVDAIARTVEFTAAGLAPNSNPYHRTLCRAALDGGALTVLTPGAFDHQLAIPLKRIPRDHIRPPLDTGWYRAPSGRTFVHTEADLVSLPVTRIRRADGSLVATLATASIDNSISGDFRFPEPFTSIAADGKTTLYGAIWRPSDFDPAKSYPVIDYIYPGPQRGQYPAITLTDFMPELGRSMLQQAFAELGFIVINVDGRGSTPLRSKEFHDYSYRNLQDPGCIADHVATLQQLAATRPWMDLSRVGITGHSGGGYASVHAMLHYPDHFHAAVASSGNHDQLGYSFAWTEKYQGAVTATSNATTTYSTAANPPFAANLRGKLLLATGDMDDNVHPALTMQLAHALIAADKDFDFIPLTNDDHTTVWGKPYFLRRAMEFFVRHLGA